MDRSESESAIAKSFILPERRSRFLELARTRKVQWQGSLRPREMKRRSKFITMMATLEHWFDPACKQFPISASDPHSEARSRIAELGASGDAYVMSEDRTIDGRMMNLEEVLPHLARGQAYGTLVVWVARGVAYYEQSELASLARVLQARHPRR